MIDAPCKYLSPDDVAELIGVTVETVRDWIRSGHLPASNVSSGARPTWRIADTDFRAWVEARRSVAVATS